MNASIDSVLVAGTDDGPVGLVILDVDGAADVLPISIGIEEAASIARGMDATDVGRPLTHDLLLDVVEGLGGHLDRIAVSGVEDGTYTADVHLDTPRSSIVVDARPSDSLALASRTGAPIDVAESVFQAGRRAPDEFDGLSDIREAAEGA